MKIILQAVKYEQYQWQVCEDLKVICLLLRQQSGYTKFPYFSCLWDSRAKQKTKRVA